MFLLDTNVISELRKPRPHGAVVAWLSGLPERQIFLPAIALGEIQAGIELTRKQDRTKALELEAWADELMEAQQVVPMDGEIFREWARMMHGKPDDVLEDAMVAATARVHGFTVATRNVKDYKPFGVPVHNPFIG
jgi:toxin FitB